MIKKKSGSKGFEKVKDHLTNYINWSINQIELDEVKQVNVEKLYKLPKSSKLLKHWVYPEIIGCIEDRCKEYGVHINYISPTYTSQRCSHCGWVRKINRKGKLFKCDKCGFEHDADLNAAVNISLELKPIGKKQRLQHSNVKGFYWEVVSSDNIVPDTKEVDSVGIDFNT